MRQSTNSATAWASSTPVSLTLSGTVPATGTLSLTPGWNLVSYLPSGAQPVSTALQGISGSYSAVLGFDPSLGALSYLPNLPASLNTLTALQASRGYWLNVTKPVSLTYPSALPPPGP